MEHSKEIEEAVRLIKKAKSGLAFTGAGISVDSGIPTFRGEGGLWSTVDPIYLEIEFFKKKPLQSWKVLKELFYDKFSHAAPNISHHVLSRMGREGFIDAVITQNIDNLHQVAGCEKVYELHGTYRKMVCSACSTEYDHGHVNLDYLPPTCYICNGILKPEIVFFNEEIPEQVKSDSLRLAENCDLLLIIGTNAEVYPANAIPLLAHKHQAVIVEVNVAESQFTRSITDIFLHGRASDIMREVGKGLELDMNGLLN